MNLEVLESELALCRLESGTGMPAWVGGRFVATVRSAEELSIVCDAAVVPDAIQASRGWRALRVAGTLDLSLTGVLVALLAPLDEAVIPIFAISSFDTDYVLVPGDRLDEAISALRGAGHDIP